MLRRPAEGRVLGAASQRGAQERIDLAHLRLRRAGEHTARVGHAPARHVRLVHGLEPREGGDAEVDVPVEETALAILELTRAGSSGVTVASSPCAAYVARFARRRKPASAAESITSRMVQ